MLRHVLLFGLILTISTIANAQSDKPADVEKAAAEKLAAAEAKALKLQNLQTIQQWAVGMRDEKIGGLTLAQLADIAWSVDEDHARSLFRFSLTWLSTNQNDPPKEVSAKTAVQRKVISLIARHDNAWARTLLDSLTKDNTRKAWSALEIANDLLEVDPKQATDFAEQSMKIEITSGLLGFLRKLQKTNKTESDRLFVEILAKYAQQQNADPESFAYLGNYLFLSRHLGPDDEGTVLVRIGDVGMPDLTANRPGISAGLVQQYIRGAIELLHNPAVDISKRSQQYALGYLLMPKAQEFGPSLAPELVAAMAALSTTVPAQYSTDDAYKYLTKKPAPPEDRLAEIEKTADSYVRDQLYLDFAFQYYRKDDFATARLGADKIGDLKLRDEVGQVLTFGENNQYLQSKTVDLDEAAKRLNKMPQTFERALLMLAAAAVVDRIKPIAASEFLDSARDTAKRLGDKNSPFLLMYVAGELQKRKSQEASTVLNEAAKEFNKTTGIEDPDLAHDFVNAAGSHLRFPLVVKDVNIAFQQSFANAVKNDEENAILSVNDIKDERLRGIAYIVLTRAILAKPSVKKIPETVTPPAQIKKAPKP